MISFLEMNKMALLNTLGLSVLVETLMKASKFIYLKNGSSSCETASCYFFVQGTGLDLLLQRYQLSYDPEELREKFNYYLGKKKEEPLNYRPWVKSTFHWQNKFYTNGDTQS